MSTSKLQGLRHELLAALACMPFQLKMGTMIRSEHINWRSLFAHEQGESSDPL